MPTFSGPRIDYTKVTSFLSTRGGSFSSLMIFPLESLIIVSFVVVTIVSSVNFSVCCPPLGFHHLEVSFGGSTGLGGRGGGETMVVF